MTLNTNNTAGNTPKAAQESVGNKPAIPSPSQLPTAPTAHSPTATPGTFHDPGSSPSLNTHFMSGIAHQTSGPGLSPTPPIQPRTYNMAAGSILSQHGPSGLGSGNEPQDKEKVLYGSPGESESQVTTHDLPAMTKRLQVGNPNAALAGASPASATGSVPSPTMASSPTGPVNVSQSRY